MSAAAKAAIKVEVFIAATWVDISADLVAEAGMEIKYGIDGNGPADVLASVGYAKFTLRNDAGCSGHVQGYYSPRHASRRSGWTTSLPCRITLTYASVAYVKHRGTLTDINPAPGRYATQRVVVVSSDAMYNLMEADASKIALQENKTEAELQSAVFAAIPSTSQPVSVSLDTGLDVFPVSFDTLSSDKAMGLLKDAVQSSFGLAFIKGDGTYRYFSRHARSVAASALTLNDTMHELSAPSSVDRLFNHFRMTIHPKTITATPTELLYTLPSGVATINVPGMTSIDVTVEYTDPNNRQQSIGGSSVVTTLIAGTHYAANTLADGTGTDMTASIVAVLTDYGPKANYHLTNSDGGSVFMTILNVYGKAVRDPGPQTIEYTIVQPYGERVQDINLKFQNDSVITSDAAHYLANIYSTLTDLIDSVGFIANNDTTNMVAALSFEPGTAITVTETVSGVSLKAIIMAIRLLFDKNGFLTCRWGLATASQVVFWQWGIAGTSEWGLTTLYGF